MPHSGYTDQIYYFLLLTTFYFSVFHVYPKTKLGALCFQLMAISGLVSVYHTEILNAALDQKFYATMSDITLHSTMFLICAFVFVFLLSKRGVRNLIEWLSIITFFNATYLIWLFSQNRHAYALMLNTSMEGTFLAMMLPILLLKKDQMKFMHKSFVLPVGRFKIPLLYFVPIMGTLASKGSMGIGGMALGFLAYFIMGKNLKKIIVAFLTFASSLMAGYYLVGSKFFSDSRRIICWEWCYEWWIKNANHWFGTGLGATWGISPFIQVSKYNEFCGPGQIDYLCEIAKIKYQHGNYYTFMHSDWLQLVFEMGITGALIGIITYFAALKNSYNKRWLFIALIVAGSQGVANMPIRYVASSLLCVILLRVGLERKENVS